MKKHVDVIVIGAGPAGLSCATSLANLGLDVMLLDEQPTPGGQIYKNIENVSDKCAKILGEDYTQGREIVRRLRLHDIEYFSSATVWQVNTDGYVYYSVNGSSHEALAKYVVVSTGAMERPVPFLGWTLPGVMGAGGANNLIKDGGLVPNGRVVLAGSGPLLFLEANHLIDMGVDIKAILESTPKMLNFSSLFHMLSAIRRMDLLKKGISMLQKIKTAGISHYKAIKNLSVTGRNKVECVHAIHENTSLDIEADMLFTHFGVIPNIAIYRQLGCSHQWNKAQRYWYPECDKWGKTSHQNIFAAGDGAFVHGAVSAALKGEMTALAIATEMQMLHEKGRDLKAGPIERQLCRELALSPFIDAIYAPTPNLYDIPPETIVCRCEGITMGQICEIINEGCVDPNEVKVLLRPGMGPCQGKMCNTSICEIISQRSGIDIKEVGTLNIRPPLKNISLHEISNVKLDGIRDVNIM